MTSIKYYDHHNSRPIDLKKDGCELSSWKELHGKALFARHSKGFLVFVPPDEIAMCDEYKESDPYTVEADIDGEFQNMRIGCTLELIEEAAKKIQGTLKILDLGCGQGHITSRIKKAYPNSEISGLDYSCSAIEYAHDNFPGIDFIVADAYGSPYDKSYFDIIVCNNLWEHMPDPLLLLKRISTILKPSAFLIISTPSRYRLGNLLRVIRGKSVNLRSKHHVTEYSVGQVIEQVSYGKYKVIKILSKPYEPYATLSFKRKAANMVFSSIISFTGSHHKLESTVFYLAQKKE